MTPPVLFFMFFTGQNASIGMFSSNNLHYHLFSIEQSQFDGSCRKVVVQPSAMFGGRPHSMVYADALYWTNENLSNGKYTVHKTNITTGNSTVVSSTTEKLFGITFIWPEKRKLDIPGDKA